MKISHREQWLISIAIASLFVALTWYIVDLKLPDYRAHKIEIDRIEHQLVRDQRRINMQQDWMINSKYSNKSCAFLKRMISRLRLN